MTASASTSPATTATARRRSPVARITAGAAAALAATAAIAGVTALSAQPASAATAGTPVNCAAAPSSCGYPDASNAGVPAGTTLKTVPGQVSSGPGWHYDAASEVVQVDGAGATLTGLYIPYGVNIKANNVTLTDDKIVTGGASAIAVSLRHTAGVTISHDTIAGIDAGANRMMTGVKDVYGDSTGMTIAADDISRFETGVQLETGMIRDNYIHDPGYITGDHTNGVMSNGGTAPLTITHNTIFNNRSQTDAIALFEDFGTQANRTVTGNLLAGGSYTIYGGATKPALPTSNITITGNRIATTYYPAGGSAGPAAYFDSAGTGNTWTGNIWDNTGQAIPAP